MGYDISIKQKAIKLRESGYSIKEIAHLLDIALSSSSVWVRNVPITEIGLSRMIKRKELNRYKMSQEWIKKRKFQDIFFENNAKKIIERTPLSANTCKILCATLFWAEGSKMINHVAFTNSDPIMIATFLSLFRKSFILEERKFHVSMHLHEYHNLNEIKHFWGKITNIPETQFIRPYLKPHTAIRKKVDYKGCISVRYYDVKIARELTAIYNALGEKFRGVVQR